MKNLKGNIFYIYYIVVYVYCFSNMMIQLMLYSMIILII